MPEDQVSRVPVPPMLYKPASPLTVKVLSNDRLTPENHTEEVRHIVLDISNTDYIFAAGQSLGIIAPGTDERGKPHRVRLYSIASGKAGEKNESKDVSICVKRVVQTLEDNSVYQGICSNHLCDAKPGDEVMMSGPNGKKFALPEDDSYDLLMFATGTGIAPYRSFLQDIERSAYKGKLILYYGARTTPDLVYDNEQNSDLKTFESKGLVKLYRAKSREIPGQRIHVQDVFRSTADEIRDILSRDRYMIYICGIKGMETGIEKVFSELWNGPEPFEERKAYLKSTARWVQEVY